MLQEELVTHEVAKLAKEKGFNEKCYHYYQNGTLESDGCFNRYNKGVNSICSAPTQSILQRWLREEKAIAIVLQPYSYDIQRSTYSWIYEIWADNNFEKTSKSFKTYELALENALKYTLKNLI